MEEEIKSILRAYPVQAVRAAIKEYSLEKREKRILDQWQIWTEERLPPRPYEWRKLGKLTYYRMPPPAEEQVTVAVAVRPQSETSLKRCPDCGAEAFAQAVCPACAKGRAGIRRMWICGENSDHVFYTG